MRLVLAVFLVSATVLAGCSGDDDDAAGSTSETTTSTAADQETTTTTVATTTTTAPPLPDPVHVTGPVTAATPLQSAALTDLAAVGYVEEEYFIDGDAAGYEMVGEVTTNGEWEVSEGGSAAYASRIVVRRPADAADFSGVVMVEWLNVSAGRDGDPDWGYTQRELIREGHAWVGVSAQKVGLDALVAADAARYGSLVHPGDAYSFDIFTQAGESLVSPDGPSPLGDLVPTTVIAAGESQSAFFLTTYVNGIHPLVGYFDGFLIHSRGGGAPGVDGARVDVSAAEPIQIRTDLAEPVMIFMTETDLTVLGYYPARQDDSDSVRLWEVAGTAHADAYLLEEVYGLKDRPDLSNILNCSAPLNAGPQHEILEAALSHLVTWVLDGTLPPESPRLEIEENADGSYAIARDERGNALGGIRTGLVDAPVAALSGDPAPGSDGGFCFLFGTTTPFDAATLAELYPTPQDYLDAFAASTEAAVEAGFLQSINADEMLAKAEEVAETLGGPA